MNTTIRHFSVGIISLCAVILSACQTTLQTDVLVIGGGGSGITAGIQSARSGAQTLLVEETPWLGGLLTAAGVSAVDGNYRMRAGLFGEFVDSLAQHYGGLDSLKTGWVSNILFEPSVGNRIFWNMAQREDKLQVWSESTVTAIQPLNDGWQVTIRRSDGSLQQVRTQQLIDATELGDIARLCGVPSDVGMESRQVTGEVIAPDEPNDIIQDLTYVAVLKEYNHDVTLPQPEGYDPAMFTCTCVNPLCTNPSEPNRMHTADKLITYGKLPNGKYMINWPIEGNDYYLNLIDSTADARQQALQYAKHFTLCYVYFLQHELGFNHLGLADDEFPTPDHLPFIPYYRESRRIHGVVRFTVNHMKEPYSQPQPLYRTGIAVGDYAVDHHHKRYHGTEELPDLHFHPIPSFNLPLGALIPAHTPHLLVAEKSISVSNIANGATRLQPVVMQIGQAAGTLAALAVKQGIDVSQVSVRQVQQNILDAGGYLMPYLDVEKTHPDFACYQRIGATGILQGEGKNVGWANQTWLRINDPLLANELSGLSDYYPGISLPAVTDNHPLTQEEFADLIKQATNQRGESISMETKAPDSIITRGEAAQLIDRYLQPFNRDINIQGQLINK